MRILLRDLTPGTNYTLQLRQNDGTNVSDWSRIFELLTTTDTTAPAQVENVTWEVNGSAFIGRWDATTLNADATPCNDLSHYIVRIASPSAGTFDVNTTNNFFDFSFEENTSLFGTPQPDLTITVFAVDIAGNMSVASTSENAVNAAPPDPTNVVAAGIVGGISILWDVQTIDDLAAYDIFTSTSGPGFTPDSSNHVWSGTSNSYIHESNSLGVVNYFKIRARDVFESISNYVTVSATPVSPVDIDTTPPGTPADLAAMMTSDPDDSAFAIATVTWTAVSDADLAGYVVRYKPTSATSYNFVNIPVGNTSVVIEALVIGIQYDFSIQAFDQLSNRSAWSSTVNATAANTAPSTPAAATAVASTQSIQVSHDLEKATSGRLESDVSYLQVHLGTSSGFTADDTNLIGSMQVEPGSTFVSAVFTTPVVDSSVDRWVRVIAVDRGGLQSAQSAVSAVTVGLILNANIANATITTAKINDLEANKITAGTGIINNLLIKSSLTVDTAGIVQSSNYSAGVDGWRLTENSLEINDGVIRAAALELQDAPNICPPEYADFEFFPSFYTGNQFTFDDGGTTTASIATSPEITAKNNLQVLKHVWTGGGTFSRVYQAPTSTTYNINVEPATDYIVSGWFRVLAGGGAKNVGMSVKTGDAVITQVVTSTSIPDDGAWHRISGVFNTTTQTQLLTLVSLFNAGTVYVDALQVERKLTSETDPSPWRPPSYTRIDGGVIRTGSIQSTAAADGLGGQPAWSINTTGGAQFGDAAVRGRLVVGDVTNPSGDGVNSRIHSANYVANTSGWIIRNDGSAEFSSIILRSDGTDGAVKIANGGFVQYDDNGDLSVEIRSASLGILNEIINYGLPVYTDNKSIHIGEGRYVKFRSDGQASDGEAGLQYSGTFGVSDHEFVIHSSEPSGSNPVAIRITMVGTGDYTTTDPVMTFESNSGLDNTIFNFDVNDEGSVRINNKDIGRGSRTHVTSTANSATTTTGEVVHVTTPTTFFLVGRAYRATYHYQGQSTIANDQIGFRMRLTNTAGNSLFDSLRTLVVPTANGIVNGESSQYLFNNTGSDFSGVIVGTVYRTSGTGTVNGFANAANPVWLTIEDVGEAADFPGIKAL
jgi:hypothetical protein